MIHYGATEADWFHFDGILDLGQDLLPVVSNASAPISPASKLKMAGKVPSVYDRQRQIVGIARWTSHTATPADLKRWSGEPDYGICLITRSARAIDIDITDEAQALEIRKCVTDHLGELPMRSRADSSKVLFLFALPGDLPKRVIKTAHGLVELLGSGQQAVVAGTHPGGARYEWPAGLPSELRLVTPEELDALWAELERRFAIEPSTTSKASTKAATLANAVSNDPVVVALYEKGLVTGTAADGKIFLTCPFEAEHERESDISATAYLPAHTGGYARGSFLCLHSPCSGRTSADFLNAIGIFEDHRDDFQAVPEIVGAKPDNAQKSVRFAFLDDREFAGGPPMQWFIKGVLPKAEFGIVYGPPGSGKSFFVLDLGMAIERGVSWRGFKVNRAKIGYVAAEGAGGLKNRITAYRLVNKIEPHTALIKVLAAAPNLLNKDDVVALGLAIRAAGVKLVFYDTLARGTVGGDENSAKDMGVAIANCQTLHQVTGAMVVLVHHSGKDASKGARGSTAILGANDVEIEITREDENRTARVSKLKDGEDGRLFGFALKVVSVGMDEDGDDISSCVVEHTEAVAPREKAKRLGRRMDLVLRAIQDEQRPDNLGALVQDVIDTYRAATPLPPGGRDQRQSHVLSALESLALMGKCKLVAPDRVVLITQGE